MRNSLQKRIIDLSEDTEKGNFSNWSYQHQTKAAPKILELLWDFIEMLHPIMDAVGALPRSSSFGQCTCPSGVDQKVFTANRSGEWALAMNPPSTAWLISDQKAFPFQDVQSHSTESGWSRPPAEPKALLSIFPVPPYFPLLRALNL